MLSSFIPGVKGTNKCKIDNQQGPTVDIASGTIWEKNLKKKKDIHICIIDLFGGPPESDTTL